jgi:serine/threonine protein kinase
LYVVSLLDSAFSNTKKLQKIIGKGQWGTVYLGEDITTEERVAIKQVKLKGIPKDELTSIIVCLSH